MAAPSSGGEPRVGPTEGGHLAENLLHFARVLRAAGLPVGSDRVQLALQALRVAGLASRTDFKSALAACLVDRVEHRALFDQAFHIFWRDPDLLGRVMAMLLPRVEGRVGPPPPENRRLAEALFPQAPPPPDSALPPEQQQIEIDAQLSWSDKELLRQQDFETMTGEEWAQARRLVAQLQPFFETRRTRRHMAAMQGRIAWRATLRGAGRSELLLPRRERPRERVVPLVVLADISGSMSRYSRMLLHLAHGLTNPAQRRQAPRVESFVFGTRLTRITRLLRQRDPDQAVASVASHVADWSGGTRISDCLHQFNRDWARRVLAGDATVLLISDGLEQGPGAEALAFEARRLRLSCRRLVWLNPLLRFEGFEPRAAGIRALLPEVSHHVPAHNLASLEDLVTRLLCN